MVGRRFVSRRVLVSAAILLWCVWLPAQSVAGERMDFERFFALVLNYLGENDEGEGMDVEELYDRLSEVYAEPIEWNGATRRRLEELLFVPDVLVENLLYYADVYGPVRSIYELSMVPDIEAPMLLLLPNVLVVEEERDTAEWRDAFGRMSHSVSVRMDGTVEPRAGFSGEEAGYAGIPLRVLARYNVSAGKNFRAAVSMESDAGEPWFGKGGRGFDLYRFYAQADNVPYVGRVVAGAYRVSYGQGLLFGTMSYGSRVSRLLNTGSVHRAPSGYGGVSEGRSLFGVASSSSVSVADGMSVDIDLLYSYSGLDADTSGGGWRMVSESGYHRTQTERDRRGTVGLHTVGADVSLSAHRYRVGVAFYGGMFSVGAVAPAEYSGVAFAGDRQFGASAHYSARFRGLRFAGETAVQHTGAVATVNTLHLLPSSSLTVALNHRYISQGYHSFWADVPVAVGASTAEHGAGVAVRVPVARGSSLSLLGDVFLPLRHTSVTSSYDLGYEVAAEADVLLGESVGIKPRMRYRVRPRWERVEGECMSGSVTERVGLASVSVYYPVSEHVRLNTVLQGNVAHRLPRAEGEGCTAGVNVYQDVAYVPRGLPLDLRGRVSFCYSPEWDNRFYAYEYDVSAAGYSPAMYGVAFRWYVMARYRFGFGLDVSARVSQSVYLDREYISSGRDRIEGNHRTDVHVYVSWRIDN